MRRLARTALAVTVLLLAPACSDDGDGADRGGPAAEPDPGSPTPSVEPGADDVTEDEVCDLLDSDEVGLLLDGAGDAQAGLSGRIPHCTWTDAEGAVVQVVSAPAEAWSRALPALLDQLEAGGGLAEGPTLRRLRSAADLVQERGALSDDQACELFSRTLQLQGLPPGSSDRVTVVPDPGRPQAVSGETCTDGRYTSVSVSSPTRLTVAPSQEAVAEAVASAHDRSIPD